MSEDKEQHSKKPRKRRGRRLLVITVVILSALLLLQLTFFFYSDQIFGRILREVVYQQSNKLYRLEYKQIRFNFFANEFAFKEAKIVLQPQRYAFLYERKQVKSAFSGSCKRLEIIGPSLFKLYRNRELEVKKCELISPDVHVWLPDSMEETQSALTIHEVVLKNLNLLKIHDLLVLNGSISVSQKQDTLLHLGGLGGDVSNLAMREENDSATISIDNIRTWSGKNNVKGDSAGVALDSFYAASKDSLFYCKNLRYQSSAQKKGNQVSYQSDSFILRGLHFWKLYQQQHLQARRGDMHHGYVAVERVDSVPHQLQYARMSRYVKSLDVNELHFHGMAVDWLAHKRIPKLQAKMGSCSGQLKGFGFDSSRFAVQRKNLFSKSWLVNAFQSEFRQAEGKPLVEVESIKISSDQRFIDGDKIEISFPNKPKQRVGIASVNIHGIDPILLNRKKYFSAQRVVVKSPEMELQPSYADSSTGFSVKALANTLRQRFSHFAIGELLVMQANATSPKSGKLQNLKVDNANVVFEDVNADYPNKKNASVLEEFAMCKQLKGKIGYVSTSTSTMKLHYIKNVSFDATKEQVWVDALSVEQLMRDSALQDSQNLVVMKDLAINGWDYTKMVRERRILLDQVKVSGKSRLKWQIKKPTGKENERWEEFYVSEAILDSLNLELVNEGKSETYASYAKTQLCDIRWRPKDSFEQLSVYGFEFKGKDVSHIDQVSGHALSAGTCHISSQEKKLYLGNLRIEPMADHAHKLKLQLQADALSLANFQPENLTMHGVLRADELRLVKADIKVTDNRKVPEAQRKENLKHPGKLLKGKLKQIDIATIDVSKSDVWLRVAKDSVWNVLSAHGLNLYLYQFHIDSQTLMRPENLLCAKSSYLDVADLRQSSRDGKMQYGITWGQFYPHDQLAFVEKLDISNRYVEEDPRHFSVLTERATTKGFDFYKFLVEREMMIDSLHLQEPKIVTYSGKREDKKHYYEHELPTQLTSVYQRWNIEETTVDEGIFRLGLIDSIGLRSEELISGVKGHFFHTALQRPIPEQFLFTDSIHLEIDEYRRVLPDSLNDLYMHHVGIDIHNQRIKIDSFCLLPRYDASSYGVQVGHRVDWIQAKGLDIQVDGFDFKAFLYYSHFDADSMLLSDGQIRVYTDKTLDPAPATIKPMPQDMLRKLPIDILVGKMKLRNWFIEYREQHPDGREPGEIHFTDFDADIKNICNQRLKDTIGTATVLVNAKLMGKSRMEIQMHVPYYNNPYDSFYFEGELDEMDMKEINPILENLAFLSITNGQAEGLYFKGYADELAAVGSMSFYYSDLKVNLLNKPKDPKNKMRNALGNFVLNFFVIKNKKSQALPQTGVIYQERDHSKSVFHYGAKAIISGIIDSIK